MTLAMWNWNTTPISMPTMLELIKLDRELQQKRKNEEKIQKQKQKAKNFAHRSNHGLPSKAKKITLLIEVKLMKFFDSIRKRNDF